MLAFDRLVGSITAGKKLVSYCARPLTWRTLLYKWSHRSDRLRWANPKSLSANWNERTIALGRLIQPGSSVLEFGAGRMILKEHLPAGCRYTPSDIVDRGEGTLVFDLNAKVLPDFPQHDVAVFSGVLEYVHDVPRLIRHVRNSCPQIATSYAPALNLTAMETSQRLSRGWVNAYSPAEFEAIVEAAGFGCCERMSFGTQMLYFFDSPHQSVIETT